MKEKKKERTPWRIRVAPFFLVRFTVLFFFFNPVPAVLYIARACASFYIHFPISFFKYVYTGSVGKKDIHNFFFFFFYLIYIDTPSSWRLLAISASAEGLEKRSHAAFNTHTQNMNNSTGQRRDIIVLMLAASFGAGRHGRCVYWLLPPIPKEMTTPKS